MFVHTAEEDVSVGSSLGAAGLLAIALNAVIPIPCAIRGLLDNSALTYSILIRYLVNTDLTFLNQVTISLLCVPVILRVADYQSKLRMNIQQSHPLDNETSIEITEKSTGLLVN